MSDIPEWKKQLDEAERQRKEAESKPEYQARYARRAEMEGAHFWIASDAKCDACGQVGWVLVADSSMEEYAQVTLCVNCLSDLWRRANAGQA